jgi:hypothetical protein
LHNMWKHRLKEVVKTGQAGLASLSPGLVWMLLNLSCGINNSMLLSRYYTGHLIKSLPFLKLLVCRPTEMASFTR